MRVRKSVYNLFRNSPLAKTFATETFEKHSFLFVLSVAER
jgi:hypothetical protein